ncbi:MAG: lipopolysaccharide biosynthesis protein RfbH [Candidatus Omnitrophica bacterium]|nr:lipopolysaccharide biosynthesis protein RfbH [Candidatus Omnitrophota bacterium]
MEKEIRKKIHLLVRSLIKRRLAKQRFVPGTSPVHYSGRVYDEKEVINLVDASLDFWLTAGRFAEEFERKLAKFIGVRFCLLTNSGSSANLLALSALTSPLLKERRLKPGDEVITTACGFPTTLNPMLQNNLIPVFVDIDLKTYNIDAKKIERAISKKTKAIFLAHTLGNPANLLLIKKMAEKYHLWVIEDNCDALGAQYSGKHTGSFGDIATFSFYPAHHITMGEGGAVVTDNPQLRRILLSFRDWGRDCFCDPGKDNTCGRRFGQKFAKLPFGYDHKYVYSHIGYNLKATDMQASIGVAQMDKLPSFIKMRRENFQRLRDHLDKYRRFFHFVEAAAHSQPSWFGFPLLIKKSAPFSRGEIVSYLEQRKIATRMLFGGNLTKQPAYKDSKYRIAGSLKNTDLVMNDLFWIGVYPGLDSDQLSYVLSAFDDFLKQCTQKKKDIHRVPATSSSCPCGEAIGQ